ncbi:DUF2380 domain-containing protein [Archangium minus]|uniref:DUF2380 domain-containing protein n=1 Tax=Archangium minus TaxID=83450 RepID=UPI0037C15BAB
MPVSVWAWTALPAGRRFSGSGGSRSDRRMAVPDIHAFTVRVPKSFHQWLHSGGPAGGQWNEAWRQFMDLNRNTAKAEDIWRFAGELLVRFGVNGPFVPYSCD